MIALAAGCTRSPSGPSARPAEHEDTASEPAKKAASAEPAPEAPLPPPFTGGERSVASDRGLVVAAEAQAARAGARILADGGNAVDAAIATAIALSVTHPSAGGLGGGGFALVRPKGGPTRAFDFREVAPKSLTRARFDKMIEARGRGKAAVGVPGCVAGLELMRRELGSMPFEKLVAPALELAKSGFVLGPWQARVLGWSYRELSRDPRVAAIFGNGKRPKREGARIVQPDLAWTLTELAKNGPESFYRGAIAKRLASALAPEGPSLEDLASYRAVLREPLTFHYRGYELETMPPPSAGGVALAGILLSMQRAGSEVEPGSPDAIHLFLEASRRAQAERRLGVVDPDALAPAELSARLARWLDPAFWLTVPIEPQRATPSERVHPLFAEALRETEHTTHLSVTDRTGMVVSLTMTLSASFGAKIMAAGTGMFMNNSVGSFASIADNQPVPGRRTTSSMAPTLLLRGKDVAAVLGSPGGDTIPSTIAQLVHNLVDRKLPLDAAIDAPRFHHGFVPDTARHEPSAPKEILKALAERGHTLAPYRRSFGDANCIVFNDGRAYGYADQRELGTAVAP